MSACWSFSDGLKAHVGTIDITGQLVTREFAYPFEGRNYTSPGMTIRQWYAGMALQGFISKSVAANLIGTLPVYCFKLADFDDRV